MWWSEAPSRTLLLGVLALAGCGFTPAYGPQGSAGALRGAVAVEASATIPGYLLRERLLDRLGAPVSPRYELEVAPEELIEQAAISPEGAVTRYRLVGSAAYSLTELATGTEVTSGTVDSFAGYSATLGTVASASAEDDARERLATALADLIVTRLLAASPAAMAQ